MPRKRYIAAIVAGIGALILLPVLLLSIFRWSIDFDLFLWFLFLLFVFHFIFFFCVEITQTLVKSIDYPYLLIGAFAIFLAFAGGEEERHRYISALNEIRAPSTKVGLQWLIQGARDTFCSYKGNYVPQNFCSWTDPITQFFSQEYTPERLKQQIVEAQRSAVQSQVNDLQNMAIFLIVNFAQAFLMGHNFPQSIVDLSKPTTIFATANATYPLIIASMGKIYDGSSAKPTNTEGVPEFYSIAALERVTVGLGKVLVWPFILAIALALRLTKVTADVLGWAAVG